MVGEMTVETMHDLFVYELQGMYDVESKLVDALDELAMKTSNDAISDGFAEHRDETRDHVARLEDAFEALDVQPQGRESTAVNGLIEEKERFDEVAANDDVRDMYYLGAGMKTERMEITGYESLLTLADELGLDDAATDPLQQNLSEEEKTLSELQTMASGSKLKSLVDRITG